MPIPYFMHDGYLPYDGRFPRSEDIYARTIVFSEELYILKPSAGETLPDNVVMMYNTSGLPLPIDPLDKIVEINPR